MAFYWSGNETDRLFFAITVLKSTFKTPTCSSPVSSCRVLDLSLAAYMPSSIGSSSTPSSTSFLWNNLNIAFSPSHNRKTKLQTGLVRIKSNPFIKSLSRN
ncbi:hypothetical protein YC2023_110827 [Brassica napus]